jgi:membrane protease YdiL (CAAX protease family)
VPTLVDWLLFVLVVLGLAVRAWFGMRTLRGLEDARAGSMRPRLWARAILTQWSMVAVLLAWWIVARRHPADLGLALRPTWGLGGVLVGTGLITFVLRSQRRQVETDDDLAGRVRRRLGGVTRLLPHSREEWPGFASLAITAGICEEILFRGFVTWHLSHLFTVYWAAALVQAVLFGLAHSYQGPKGVLATGLAGLFFTAIVAVTGSLWAAMLLHAMVDLHSGALAWRVLSRGPAAPATTS